MEQTPTAGEPGTAIYSAHRETHFAFLGEVAIGDEIRVTRRDGAVSASASPTPRSCTGMHPGSIRSRPAATSCSRPAGRSTRRPGPLRYLVHAELIGALP